MKLAFPLLTILVYALLSGTLAVRSDGVCIDDDLCHYQIARAAWRDPQMLLNIWGRPGFTLPHAAVAGIGSTPTGFRACRLLTSAMMTGVVCLTWLLARRIRAPFAFFVPLMLLLMPEGFGQSFTPCTEAPAALYGIAAAYLLACGHRRWAAIFLAILPATRHELAALILPLGLYFLWRRDFLAVLLLCWFELAWNLISRRLGLELPIMRYLTRQDATLYGSGNALHFLVNWIKVAGAILVPIALVGAVVIARHQWHAPRPLLRLGPVGRAARVRILIIGGAVGLVALETFLFSFNRFASGGYSKFLFPGIPFTALCACYGIRPIIALFARPGIARFTCQLIPASALGVALFLISRQWIDLSREWRIALAALIGVAALFAASRLPGAIAVASLAGLAHWSHYARPYHLTTHQALIGRTVAQLRRSDPACLAIGHSAWVFYFDEPSRDVPALPAKDLWRIGKLPHLYYIYDDAPGFSPPLSEITSRLHHLVFAVRLSADDTTPDLYVFHRLPDRTPSPRRAAP